MNIEASITYNTISNKRYEIIEHMKKINILENKIKYLKKNLFNCCEHEWVRDWEDRDVHSNWICKNCKLYKNPNYN